jgi:hypothetical protein
MCGSGTATSVSTCVCGSCNMRGYLRGAVMWACVVGSTGWGCWPGSRGLWGAGGWGHQRVWGRGVGASTQLSVDKCLLAISSESGTCMMSTPWGSVLCALVCSSAGRHTRRQPTRHHCQISVHAATHLSAHTPVQFWICPIASSACCCNEASLL